MCIYMRLWLIYVQFSVPRCLGSCLLWGAQPSATKLDTEYKCRDRQLWHFSSRTFLGESKGSSFPFSQNPPHVAICTLTSITISFLPLNFG